MGQKPGAELQKGTPGPKPLYRILCEPVERSGVEWKKAAEGLMQADEPAARERENEMIKCY